jgi:hypothetical protein
VTMVMNLWVPRSAGCDDLLACQEGHCSMELILVSYLTTLANDQVI